MGDGDKDEKNVLFIYALMESVDAFYSGFLGIFSARIQALR